MLLLVVVASCCYCCWWIQCCQRLFDRWVVIVDMSFCVSYGSSSSGTRRRHDQWAQKTTTSKVENDAVARSRGDRGLTLPHTDCPWQVGIPTKRLIVAMIFVRYSYLSYTITLISLDRSPKKKLLPAFRTPDASSIFNLNFIKDQSTHQINILHKENCPKKQGRK